MRIALSGDVGWEITPQGVREAMEKAGGADVEIVVSSRGGLVGAALEIYNMIRNYPGKTTAILSGYAMSAASYIPMAADRVLAEDNAVMMIHNAWGIAIGDHNEMKKVGGILGGLSSLLSGAYARFTGKSKEEIGALMDAETWLFGDGITAAGFAHETIEADESGEKDQESAMAAARMGLDTVRQRLAVAQAAVQSDLTRVTNMLPGGIGNSGDVPRASSTKEPVMDLKTLKEKHPDLVAAIVAEAIAGMDEKVAQASDAGRKEGSEAERARIADVRAQLIPGHEQLVEAMAFDGKSTGADAAKAIVQAEKDLRAKALKEMNDDTNPPAKLTGGQEPQQETMKREAWKALSVDAQRDFITAGGKVID